MPVAVKISLTIVVPTLNSGETLAATLVSLRPLVARGATVMVVDSYSDDETQAIAMAFGATIRQVAEGNMYQAINEGMANASSDWITYINGDDILYADAVIEGLITLGSNADVIYGSIDYIDLGGRFLHSWNSPPPEDFLDLAAEVMPIPQAGTLFRRSVSERLGGFCIDYRYSGDFDFFLRAKLGGFRFARLERPRMAGFRVHPTQTSQIHAGEMRREVALSIARNGVHRRWWRQRCAFFRFRMRNWDSYVLRLIRARHLKGRAGIRRTIGW